MLSQAVVALCNILLLVLLGQQSCGLAAAPFLVHSCSACLQMQWLLSDSGPRVCFLMATGNWVHVPDKELRSTPMEMLAAGHM
jgi:hypothetical protein